MSIDTGWHEMSQKDHWEQVYASKATEELGWYEPRLQTSLNLIQGLGLAMDASIIDVGGGTSTLVDDLLDAGYRSITVLDISEKALCLSRQRLGSKAELVTWRVGDMEDIDLPEGHYDLWHDRAVFHFLTGADQQHNYRDTLLRSLAPGGHFVVGTFAPEAPPTCSGLPVQRYSPEQLEATLGERFELIQHRKSLHMTPGRVRQMYLYCHFRKTS
ncbi:class I SAM-dependent methyltransferase [Halomonas sp.]|uniref:class I SAM-dependent methyltransferase n=1 Tax=Halomonas sp. TaxID=1486246 RepID=UPI00298DCE76|nr:class I SAM-dependent methyltransferase [Halomonas sp.]MDW7748295.1 class I SAM-dependent methyltransferase [Halomonas sp.]